MKNIKNNKTILAVIPAVVVLAAGVAFFCSRSGNTDKQCQETVERLQKLETADISSIEDAIRALSEKEKPTGSDSEEGVLGDILTDVQIKQAFQGTVIVGDSITESIAEYGFLDTSIVVAKLGLRIDDADDQINTAISLNPSVFFLSFGANDLEIYKKHGIWAVINAGSNSKLASGIAPLEKMQKAGINTAIGTDGPSSNNALDMFREMYLAAVTQKLKTSDAAACDAAELLKSATVGGAHCMGLYNCDIIDNGKKADLTVIDLHRPNMQPINNIIKNIVYSGSKENVKLTMINGKILYENGEFIGTDIEKIYYEAQKIADRLKSIL